MTTKTLQDTHFIGAALFVLGVSQVPSSASADPCLDIDYYSLFAVEVDGVEVTDLQEWIDSEIVPNRLWASDARYKSTIEFDGHTKYSTRDKQGAQ